MERSCTWTLKKIARSIGILSKLRHFVAKKTLIQLHYSIIYPFLIYRVTIWGNTYKSNLSSLVTLQKKAMRIRSFSKFDEHSFPLFKSFNLLKFLDIVYFNTALFLHNFYNKKLPNIFYDFFNPVCEQHSHNTRLASRSTYSLPLVRTNYGIFNIRFIGIKIWNSIDESLRHLSLPNFKKKLKLQIINSYTKIV
jgi:hypothetical protein